MVLLFGLMPRIKAQEKQEQKLHVIIIGAHPDDADGVGGTAYKWAQLGYDVLMVSLTNGDAGHQSIKAPELAKIRREEARKAGEVIGVRYITLDNHDGQLMPTYENRLQVIKLNQRTKRLILSSFRGHMIIIPITGIPVFWFLMQRIWLLFQRFCRRFRFLKKSDVPVHER